MKSWPGPSGDEARRLAVGKLAVGAEHVIMKLAAKGARTLGQGMGATKREGPTEKQLKRT